MKTIYIIPIEPIDARYTKQWYDNIPKLIADMAQANNIDVNIVTVDGTAIPEGTTQGAFLDFAATNVYKASQTVAVSELFMSGRVNPGDKFLVTDAWNFIITPIKYMSDLLGIPVEIHSCWHAGAYDPSDILGMKMSKLWPENAERSWFYASDYNYYATEFHREMFINNLKIHPSQTYRAVRSGQPHNPNIDSLESYQSTEKLPQIMWPHRLNSDKQPEIAFDLAKQFDFKITQQMSLSKSDYYKLLGQSKIVFSCALHENLGISIMEGCLTGAIPIVPDRCSYREMYLPEFKYPTEWTSSIENYNKYKEDLVHFINDKVKNFLQYEDSVKQQQQIIKENYFNADIMFKKLLGI